MEDIDWAVAAGIVVLLIPPVPVIGAVVLLILPVPVIGVDEEV